MWHHRCKCEKWKKKQETRDEREENGCANDVGARDEKVERESEKRRGNTIIVGARDERKERKERVGCITIVNKCERWERPKRRGDMIVLWERREGTHHHR